jgi:hypothetical protein
MMMESERSREVAPQVYCRGQGSPLGCKTVHVQSRNWNLDCLAEECVKSIGLLPLHLETRRPD